MLRRATPAQRASITGLFLDALPLVGCEWGDLAPLLPSLTSLQLPPFKPALSYVQLPEVAGLVGLRSLHLCVEVRGAGRRGRGLAKCTHFGSPST
jgi:hypothetical protein